MVLRAPAAMKMALGENPKTVYNERKETPITRMATAAVIRQELSKTLEYMDKQDKADAEEDTDAPDYDAKLEALIPVLRGSCPSTSTPTGRMTLPPRCGSAGSSA